MKKIFLMLVAVVALTACQKSAPAPTGDAEKDVKAFTEFVIEKINDCKSEEELNKLMESDELKQVEETFDAYCEKNPEYKKAYEKAGEKNALEIFTAISQAAEKFEKKK